MPFLVTDLKSKLFTSVNKGKGTHTRLSVLSSNHSVIFLFYPQLMPKEKAENQVGYTHVIHPSTLTGNRIFVWLPQKQTMYNPQENSIHKTQTTPQ